MLNTKFSSVNFIAPMNNDTLIRILNVDNVVTYVLRNPDCSIMQSGAVLSLRQFVESHSIKLTFNTTADATSAHLLLRDALDVLKANIISANAPSINAGTAVAFNFGDWQDSVIDFINSVPGAPVDKDRYIVNLTVPSFNAYNVFNDQNVTVTLSAASIVEYWDSSTRGTNNGGWVIVPPKAGMFTSLDNADNKIIKWMTSSWIELNWFRSTDFKSEQPVDTTQDGQYTGISPLVDKPAGEVSVDVFVNGIDVTIGDGCSAASFLTPQWSGLFGREYAWSVAIVGSNTITLTGSNDLEIGDSLIITCAGVIKCYDITNVSGTLVTLSGVLTGAVSFVVNPKRWSKIDQGDILLWFGSYAGYQLQTDDNVEFDYITHN